MTFRLWNAANAYFDHTCFYLFHEGDCHTQAVFGTHKLVRHLQMLGLPVVRTFEWRAECFDANGRSLGARDYETPPDRIMVFDSADFFDGAKGKRIVGSVRVTMRAVILEAEPHVYMPAKEAALDGIFFVVRPGSFITGVHMYHNVMARGRAFLLRHYGKAMIKKAYHFLRRFASGTGSAWRGDAVAAVAVHASGVPGSSAIAVLHNDHWFPGLLSHFEVRDGAGRTRTFALPPLRAGATHRAEMPVGDGWAQALCIEPPLNMARFLAGEQFPDGSFTLDHAYYQQPVESRWGKSDEVRNFDRRLLDGRLIGPSNPWLCVHDAEVESLVAVSNQFHPHNEYRYDLRVFAQDGRMVLHKPDFIVLPPWGFVVPSVSAALREVGIESFQGTYLLTHSAASPLESLPSRIHVQGIYRFRGGYWSGVQSDSAIWSTPRQPVEAMEKLSAAKVRRRQLWYAPVIETSEVESMLSIANLSYTLDYDLEQTLYLRYCRGGEVVAEKELTLAPFGSALLRPKDFFGDAVAELAADDAGYGGVLIFPKTGKTYCASYMLREKKTRRFFLEHVSPIPKFESEH
jgi:hypothetical protein